MQSTCTRAHLSARLNLLKAFLKLNLHGFHSVRLAAKSIKTARSPSRHSGVRSLGRVLTCGLGDGLSWWPGSVHLQSRRGGAPSRFRDEHDRRARYNEINKEKRRMTRSDKGGMSSPKNRTQMKWSGGVGRAGGGGVQGRGP